MSDSKRFLRPEALARIARLDLRARHVVEGFLSGMHRSPYFGQSVEFRQHREYVPGDDLRHVDWKVWARQDRLYVKQFEEDTNLRCHLLVDSSASMQYGGSGPWNKYDCACTIAASLAYLVLKQQDAIGCTVFDETARRVVPPRSQRSHLRTVVDNLERCAPAERTDLLRVLRAAAETLPRRGMIILISDLLTDASATLRGLRLLRQRGHDVLVLHVMDDDELDFPFSGPTRFEGLELHDALACNPRALRDSYLEALQTFLDEIRHRCARQTIDYALVRTSQPLDAVLARFLSSRLAMQRS